MDLSYNDEYSREPRFPYASGMFMVLPKVMLGREIGKGSLHVADDYIIYFDPDTPEDIKQRLIKDYAEYHKNHIHGID